MFSVVAAKILTRGSSRRLILDRRFGALTQKKSWPSSSGASHSCDNVGVVGDAESRGRNNRIARRSLAETDYLLEDVFSRKLPLPLVLPPTTNGTRQELVLPTEDITVVSEPNRTQAEPIHAMNRNARRPKKANKGARPCSRASRRRKKEELGRRSRK